MTRPLSLLMIEDVEDDVVLILRHLKKQGFEITHRRVDTGSEMTRALDEAEWNVVLCDCGLPRFDPTGALEILRERRLDIPFIVVSGKLREDQLVDLMRTGAHDVIVKSNLARLAPAIERELHEATRRRERRRTEARLKGLVAHLPSATHLKDADGRIVVVNKVFREWFGSDMPDILGKTADDIFPRCVAQLSNAMDREATFEAGNTVECELDVPLASGEMRRLAARRFVVTGDDGEFLGIGGISTDVTKQRATEAQLIQARKMEAIGQLTGGVAHDFNNLLGVILGNLRLMERSAKDDAKITKRIGIALKATMRCAELTSRLLTFARRQALDPVEIDVNVLIAELRDILRQTMADTHEIEIQLAEDIWPIRVDHSQLENAIVNLAINSRDAMPGGGRLTIETANVVFDAAFVSKHPGARRGAYVLLAVGDDGTGIAEDVLPQVFEPFFTTKDVGQGTGLGLSMIYGFVRQSLGYVDIESEPGRGTCVRIYLPRTTSMAMAVPQLDQPLRERPTGHETVLVVDDQPLVRATAVSILEDLGYRTLEAEDGAAALYKLEEQPDIDLLFTDIAMPGGMHGIELVEKVRAVRPDLPVLYTSGHAIDTATEGHSLAHNSQWIAKPYLDDELARKVRRILGSGN